jgi:hypothetical protein
VPELCATGATADFAKYDKALSRDEAAAAFGTPAKTRWQLVASGNVDSQPYSISSSGVYRITERWSTGFQPNEYRDSFAFALSSSDGQVKMEGCPQVNQGNALISLCNGQGSQVPGISDQDIDAELPPFSGSGYKWQLYRLQ